ncbi:hypothetical protein GOODEAATRI_021887, partial [Goodea atripinnis]
VTNLQEREILLKQASGRVNIRNMPCPVSGCTYNKGRCDKQLSRGHPELTDTLRTTYINVAKESRTKQLLMELRATNPVPPMASALDLGSEDEEGADVGSPHAAPSFDCGCCRSLALENEVLKNELAKLRSSYKALHKRLKRVLKGKGLIAEHKTNKAFGYAQIYLDPTEFSWLERWIELRAQLNPKSNLVFISGSKTPAKNMAKNFHPPEIRSRLSAVMCHDTATADKFYVRHLNMEQSHEIRRLFEEATHGAPGPAPSSTSLPKPRVPAKPRSDKHKRRVSVSESSSSEEAEVPYQESGSSLEEEMEEITRAKRRLAKKREGDGKEEEDDDDDEQEQEQEQGEKDQQEEEQQEEEDLKVRDFLTLFIFTLCNSSFDL